MTAARSFCAVLMASTVLASPVHAQQTPSLKDVERTPVETSSKVAEPITLRDRPFNEFRVVATAVDQRDAGDYADNYADDIGDAVFFAPGVFVNGLDIQEPRLFIRGFAIGNSAQRTNIELLRDGAPLTNVHGATNTTTIELLSIERIDITRGVGDLRDSGGNLGGAVHLKSRTGRTTPTGLTARFDSGASIDGKPAGKAHFSIASASENLDYYASVTGEYDTGWRDNNRRVSESFHGNLGLVRGGVSTRFFLDIVNAETELAGPLTLAQLEDNPQNPTLPITLGPLFPGGPVFTLVEGARSDDFDRNIFEVRLANQTKLGLLWHDVTLGGHFTGRDVEAAQVDFLGFLDESGSEWGASLEASNELRLLGANLDYRFGGSWTSGSQSSDRFENINGGPGDQFADTGHKSKRISAFLEAAFSPLTRMEVELGGKFINIARQLTDIADDEIDRRSFTGVAARIGAHYDVTSRLRAYGAVSRAYEPPSMDVLIASDPARLSSLDEQDSFNWEAGLRGRVGDWAGFSLSYYNTDIENEIISLAEPNSFISGATFANADKTTHKGIEAGIDVHLFPQRMAARGGSLTWRNVYTHSNHRFVDGGDIRGVDGKRIGALPAHHYRGELRYDARGPWFAAMNVQLARGAWYADHTNETRVPRDPVLGFSAGYRLSDQIEVFASGENILDATYVGGVSPVLELDLDEDRVFTPGRRASVYGGVTYRF